MGYEYETRVTTDVYSNGEPDSDRLEFQTTLLVPDSSLPSINVSRKQTVNVFAGLSGTIHSHLAHHCSDGRGGSPTACYL